MAMFTVPPIRLSIPAALTATPLKTLVWNAVVELLKNPKLISQAWGCDEAANIEQGEKERLENRLRSLDRQQERLLDLYQDEQIEKAILPGAQTTSG
ncbi:MAG: hypothetical protein IPM84_18655 [Anaerolineae bacterium]|nr:hypothetical protein [Anaerolineae bacterium]